jgi:hypothetical protein
MTPDQGQKLCIIVIRRIRMKRLKVSQKIYKPLRNILSKIEKFR